MKQMKTLGLLAVTAMALVAFVGTTSASAATKFTASALGKKLVETTKETHVFTITGSEVKCTNITFAGETEGKAGGGLGFESTGQKVTPTYEGCTAFGFNATITNNNCHFLLTPSGQVHITGVNCEITILVKNVFAECHVHVTNELTIEGLTYEDDPENPGKAITVTINASGIKSHVTKSTGLCPLTVGTHEGTYTGKSTISAEGASLSFD